MTATLKNHSFVRFWDEADGCPEHGGGAKKTYTFGVNSAEVTVFYGCPCAVCVNSASACVGGSEETDVTYHTSYAAAAGRAKLIAHGDSDAYNFGRNAGW